MPLEIVDISGPIPVTSVEEHAVAILKAEKGIARNHDEFYLLWFPQGTRRRKDKEAGETLYKLPSGTILTIANHQLVFDADRQQEE